MEADSPSSCSFKKESPGGCYQDVDDRTGYTGHAAQYIGFWQSSDGCVCRMQSNPLRETLLVTFQLDLTLHK